MKKVVFDVHDGAGLVEPDGAFEMEVEAAVVEIDGADDGGGVVADEGFGMQKAGGVFVDADAVSQKRCIVGSGDGKYIPFVGNMRNDDAHVDAALSGTGQGLDQLVV